MQLTRRSCIAAAIGAPSILGVARAGSLLTGAPEHPLSPFDREVEAFMQARSVPGGALAVVKDRRLVYAKGYGWADRGAMVPVHPESLFRIASISKPITGVAVMKLVEDGKLSLGDRAFDLVKPQPILEPGKSPDARLATITIRQLLQHSSGWDRNKSGDPMFRSVRIAEAAGVPPPAGPDAVIRYMFGQPLDFDPGTKHVYSNFGYCVLGRVIEEVTGKPYEDYVRKAILGPARIRRMRIARSLEKRRAKGEVRYYTADDRKGRSVFPEPEGDVPAPYGSFNLEAMDAHGGWLASAVDLARFAAALDDPERCPLRRPETLRETYAPPPAPVARAEDGMLAPSHYACGWYVRGVGDAGKANYWHTGSLPGTATLLVRRWDGLAWAMLFNQRSEDPKLPDGAIDAALHRAANAVLDWPSRDLFDRYD